MAETNLNEIFLCDCEDVPDGEPYRIDVASYPAFAVYKVQGAYYVTDDTCSHGQASISDEGELDGFNIICTWHDGVFDIRTGAAKALPCTKPIRAYPVTVRNGGIHIQWIGPDLATGAAQ